MAEIPFPPLPNRDKEGLWSKEAFLLRAWAHPQDIEILLWAGENLLARRQFGKLTEEIGRPLVLLPLAELGSVCR